MRSRKCATCGNSTATAVPKCTCPYRVNCLRTPMPTTPELTNSEVTSRYTYGTWRFQKNWKPLEIVDAEGCYFVDSTGKRYLDFSAQLMCVSLGHKNKAVIKAIEEQANQLAFIAPGFATKARAELTKRLLEVLPAGLEKFFYAT